MHLHELLGAVGLPVPSGAADVDVSDITHDSRRVTPGALLCCLPGATYDGHDFAAEAVERGAVALVVERELALAVPQVQVESVRAVLGPLAAAFHGQPSRALRVLGVTGTNGKTSVAHLLEAIAIAAGERVGVLGTVGTRIDGRTEPATFTTPEAPDLQALLATMRDAGIETVAMEVSSHALALHRVDGTSFAATCFTNLSQDHLDLHGTMDEYFAAKARLFTRAFTPIAVVNTGDPRGTALVEQAQREGLVVRTFAVEGDADVVARDVVLRGDGATFTLLDRVAGLELPVRSRLVGRLNVENSLAAAATALAVGTDPDAVVAGLAADVRVPGRLEVIDAGQPFLVLVDYAHTPAALAGVLAEARRLAPEGRVLVVFGCGGDRDAAKRPHMGAAAGIGADRVWITNDNPRSEDPAAIADAIVAGLLPTGASHAVELDRRLAIHDALGAARADDVVVIAGKGHETGQTANGVTTPFDDREVAREELEALAWT